MTKEGRRKLEPMRRIVSTTLNAKSAKSALPFVAPIDTAIVLIRLRFPCRPRPSWPQAYPPLVGSMGFPKYRLEGCSQIPVRNPPALAARTEAEWKKARQ